MLAGVHERVQGLGDGGEVQQRGGMGSEEERSREGRDGGLPVDALGGLVRDGLVVVGGP